MKISLICKYSETFSHKEESCQVTITFIVSIFDFYRKKKVFFTFDIAVLLFIFR